MPDEFERRSRLVVLAYSVLGAMDLPTPETSDREILSAMADLALQKAAQLGLTAVRNGEIPPDAELSQLGSLPRGGAGATGGVRQAARETGVSHRQLRRDIAIASLTD
jgi:hypothetical protein